MWRTLRFLLPYGIYQYLMARKFKRELEKEDAKLQKKMKNLLKELE